MGDAAARDSWHHGEHLRRADGDRIRGVDVSQIAFLAGNTFRPQHDQAHDDRERPDQIEVVTRRLRLIFEQEADDARRDGRQHQEPEQLAVAANGFVAPRRDPETLENDLPPIPEEVGEDREQRSEVEGDIEFNSLIFPSEEVGDDGQVGGTANGKELGEALNHSEYRGLPNGHEIFRVARNNRLALE